MIAVAYGVLCLAMLGIMLFLCGYTLHAVWITWRHRAPAAKDAWSIVALIVPCKGLDPHLEENLRRHFLHDYPDYRILFTLARADDPARMVVDRLIQAETSRRSSVVVAPTLPACVEKAS